MDSLRYASCLFTNMRTAALSLAYCMVGCMVVTPGFAAEGLQQLRYNHPGLTVDLGVGLWAWPVPCDADSDGDYDLLVSCPDKPSNGVWFFENTDGDTQKHRFPVFQPGRRISKTVHYVMPSYLPTGMRVLSPGFEYPKFTSQGIEERVSLPIPAKFYQPLNPKQTKGPKIRHNQWRYVDWDGDEHIDLVVGVEDWSEYGWDDAWNANGEWTNGPLHGFVFWFRNDGTNDQPNYAAPVKVEADGKPIDTFGCPSPNFSDFDGDGDLDLLCGEFLDGFTYFRNTGTRNKPVYAAGQRLVGSDGHPLRMDLEMIVPIAFDWDRDEDIDLVVGDEDGRVALIENTGIDPSGMPRFEQPKYFKQVADTLKCGALATPYGVDWDHDGDFDLVSGNTAGYVEIFENLSGPGIAEPKWSAPRRLQLDGRDFRVMAGKNGSIQGPAEAKWGYTTLSVADWDGDARLDVILNSIWGRVEWLKNEGTREKPEFKSLRPIEVAWTDTAPKPKWTWWQPTGNSLVTQWRTTPVVHDLNGDGFVDLVMLDQEGYLVWFERKQANGALALLPPQRVFVDKEGAPLRFNDRVAGGSGRRKLCLVDWDRDDKLDLLLNSANADFYRGFGLDAGKWRFERVGTLAQQNIEGHDVSPTVVDFDADGVFDFVGGAEDGRFYTMRNSHHIQ